MGHCDCADKVRSGREKPEEEAGQDAASGGAEDGDPGVAPVGTGFACYGEDEVGQAWAEVAGGVDGVAGSATKGETDSPNERSDEPGGEAQCGAIGEDQLGAYCPSDENQDKRGGQFAEEIGGVVTDCGDGAEDASFRLGVFGDFPMGEIEEPDQYRA